MQCKRQDDANEGPALLAAALLALSGCGGGGGRGGSPEPPTVDVTGTRSGTWRSGYGVDGGNIEFESPSQNGAMVTGEASFTTSPCSSGGALSGVVSGNDLTASLTAGSIRVDADATIAGNQMNGTYDTVSAGACTGGTGTFSATR